MINPKFIPKNIQRWSKKHPTLYIWTIQKNPFRILTSPLRVLPNLITIGTARGGTESLYHYLKKHPNISVSNKREIYFFGKDPFFNTGLNWYRSFFPTNLYKSYFNNTHDKPLIVYEGTTDYIFQPTAPKQISEVLPNAKFLVMLRNPVDRAFSHFYHNIDTNHEYLDSFEETIELEPKRLAERTNKGLDHIGFNFYTYLKRGIYVEQIKRWFEFFPKEKFLFQKSEDFLQNPQKTIDNICDFVNIPHLKISSKIRRNAANYPKTMNPETRKKLVEYFKPYNEKLYELLDLDFGWK